MICMMKMILKTKISLIIFALFITLSSCEKKEITSQPINNATSGSLYVGFDNRMGNDDLVLDTLLYENALGQKYSVTKLNYIISNISLTKEDNSVYTLPKDSSYFIIKETNPYSRKIKLNNIPAGTYKSISFTIGVDSLKSISPVNERTGVLDPSGNASDMYWVWNTGYIFMKMEGESTSVPIDPASNSQTYFFHIGGYGGFSSPTINNLKRVTLDFPADRAIVPATIAGDLPLVHVYADPSKLLNGSTNINLSVNYFVMFSPYSVNIANNYTSMFNVEHVHNQ